jgi:hypothetical protein
MSDDQAAMAAPALGGRPGWRAGNRHFLIAAVLLGAAAATWNILSAQLGIWVIKEPVVWPEGVRVDEAFRMTSLPERIGPYVLHKDKEREIDADTMELLRIGHHGDKVNRPGRISNWLAVGIWRDTTVPEGSPMQYWRLEVYYYTGGADVVPHVPEICLVAGGADVEKTETASAKLGGPLGKGHEAWLQPLTFQALRYRLPNIPGTRSSYYIFSLNGRPENDRLLVRLKLTNPLVRHAYFAKIQFEPLGAAADSRQTDAAAGRFAQAMLPQILKVLPAASDVERLDREQ